MRRAPNSWKRGVRLALNDTCFVPRCSADSDGAATAGSSGGPVATVAQAVVGQAVALWRRDLTQRAAAAAAGVMRAAGGAGATTEALVDAAESVFVEGGLAAAEASAAAQPCALDVMAAMRQGSDPLAAFGGASRDGGWGRGAPIGESGLSADALSAAVQVRAEVAKRFPFKSLCSAQRYLKLSVGHVTVHSLVRTTSKVERRIRRNDGWASSSLRTTCLLLPHRAAVRAARRCGGRRAADGAEPGRL